ncbi:MAG: 2-dehydropantoate 2-reductase [Desulfobacterales bacterium]|jgi:2-dehydropantoate 2-reductase|nr:2-dehydropantoate 2-reductase [Desulfobacterales bacterium]OEU44326.1 MAG: 2-dehydropantoate 2-reductase [Desulfobacterales bacterium S7086C20]
MRIAVFGAGGVGGYFGGRLAQAGEDVVFIARGDHLKAMLKQGLKVNSVKGDFLVKPVQATNDPAQVGIVDVVLVCVKAWQVPDAAEAIRPMIGPDTVALPLQNGLEAPTQLATVLGNQHVLGGLCGLSTFIIGPGHIRHAGADPWIRFGELDNHPSERVEGLRQVFDRASGLTVEIPPDIQVALWMKFLFITVWSGVGAITRTPLGIWRSLPETRQMAENALKEIISVAQVHNVRLPENAMPTTMNMYDSFPPEITTSMQRDIAQGRPSEIDAQIGAVVRFGRAADVATPLHKFIYDSLLPMELRARGQLQFD